ncbi:snRNA-activating protein complex subunit 3 [Caenorhabditis elegans]|uniref:snRNA-activating protein complex subunit 3 n=1 Tax=Caenorhabditis elegans TaxID=6239 RepID=Q965U6_CAEEL|nr:snRNA-activating protein complex subunit 3 [Caenorhabditis elegans]CCD73452.1 snRNA-activating protein complex subunit 3 [Caenorhabditis elegans]|eukprot:NP_490706.2 SNAPc (Small Nuclear RNA Activating Complex) homolog [Caenorhabditis elegans]
MSMDIVMKSDEQPFISAPVCFKTFAFFAKASAEECKLLASGSNARESFQQATGLSEKITEDIYRQIDVSHISSMVFNREMDGGIERNRLGSQAILLDENSRRRNPQFKSIALRSLRYDHIDHRALARKSPHLMPPTYIKEEIMDDELDEVKEEVVSVGEAALPTPKVELNMDHPEKDLIISISVYLGYTRTLQYHEIRLGRLMKVTDRLELTGDHTLRDLKNAFSCPIDFSFSDDFSEKKPSFKDMAKNKWPSSMFFIHDTFYIDSNTGDKFVDPSITIRSWAKKFDYIGPMHVKQMSETRIGDLICRLGQPYVYIHQGVCEHLIVFNDLCLRDESHTNVEFPRRLVERNFRRIACDTCKEASAHWMIVDHDNLLPNSPGYLCSSCYKEFCFDVNGKKVCQFKAVPYCDRKDIGDGRQFFTELDL